MDLRNRISKRNLIVSIIVVCVLIAGMCYSVYYVISSRLDKKTKGANSMAISGFTVRYLNVGVGNCTIIRLPSGKIMMIDTGNGESAFNKTKSTMNDFKASVVDYFVLTHPDSEHVGNAVSVMEEYNVGTLFLPKIYDFTYFGFFGEIIEKANGLNVTTFYSDYTATLKDGDAEVFFLSPKPYDNDDSIYKTAMLNVPPTESDIDDMSPIILLEYGGIKFLFTGDAKTDSENLVLDNFDSEFYTHLYGKEIDLRDIDFLLVANHGKSGSNGKDFLDLIKAKYAILSTGSLNGRSIADTAVLTRITEANESARIYQTDHFGSVTVCVNESGAVKILTEKK